MRTIRSHVHGSTRGEYPVLCDYCGVPWKRKELRRDSSGRLACPDEGSGLDVTELARGNAAGARRPLSHTSRLQGAAYHERVEAPPHPDWQPGDNNPDEINVPTEPGWYVSNNGDDSADGRTPTTPLRTIAALHTKHVWFYETIYLARGSKWREELMGFPAGITVRAYGDLLLPRPIIDGSNVAPNANWTAVGGATPHVYSIAWTPEGTDTTKSAHRVWENDVMLNRAADLAGCEANAGSFFALTPNGGTLTVYVHPSDGSNLITNGKTYELASRTYCVQFYNYHNEAHIWDLECRRNMHAAGSIVVDGSIHNCVARDGYIHNVFIRGLCEDTDAVGMEPGDAYGSTTSFVTYADLNSEWSEGRAGIFRRCRAIPGTTNVNANGSRNINSNVGFYIHMGDNHLGHGMNWGAMYLEECDAQYCTLGYGGGQLASACYYKCSATGGPRAVEVYPGLDDTGIGGTVLILGGTYYVSGINSALLAYVSDFQIPDNIIIRGARCYKTGGGEGPVNVNIAGTSVSVSRCTFVAGAGALSNILTNGIFAFNENVVFGPHDTLMVRLGDSGIPIPAFTADHNAYWCTADNGAHFQTGKPGGGGFNDYVTIATWRTATGQEAHSIAQDPKIADPANGDFTIGDATVRALAGAYLDEEDDDTLMALNDLWAVRQGDL